MSVSIQTQAFFKACKELGYNQTDHNGVQQLGVAPYQLNIKHGRRQDSGTAFLKPILRRQNLKVLTRGFVTKIIINERTNVAEGVEFSYQNKLYKAYASKVIASGAIGSPQLVMLSGVGLEKHLKEVGIPVIQNLEVVSSLYDHLQVYGLTFSSNLSKPHTSLREEIIQYLDGKGPLSLATSHDGFGYFQTPVEKISDYPDLEIAFNYGNSSSPALSAAQRWKKEISEATAGINQPTSFSMYLTILHTLSSGSVRLRSSSPFDYPLIDSNCFSDPEGRDLKTTHQSVLLTLKLIETEAFKKINAKFETKPIKVCSNRHEHMSREYWYCALRYITGHDNHPVASCKMRPDPNQGDVVDAQLKVYGVDKLRVADANIIPVSTSSHINSACYMIGEKLADLLRKECL